MESTQIFVNCRNTRVLQHKNSIHRLISILDRIRKKKEKPENQSKTVSRHDHERHMEASFHAYVYGLKLNIHYNFSYYKQ